MSKEIEKDSAEGLYKNMYGEGKKNNKRGME